MKNKTKQNKNKNKNKTKQKKKKKHLKSLNIGENTSADVVHTIFGAIGTTVFLFWLLCSLNVICVTHRSIS